MKMVFGILVIVAAVYLGAELVPPYYGNYEFNDYLKTTATMETYTTKPEADIRNMIIKKAHELDIPIAENSIKVQRTGQQNRRTDFFRKFGIGHRRAGALHVNPNDVVPLSVDRGAEAFEDLQHDADVLNVGQVAERDGLIGQQARGQDRQRRVLVSTGTNRPFEAPPTLDDEAFHCHRARIVSVVGYGSMPYLDRDDRGSARIGQRRQRLLLRERWHRHPRRRRPGSAGNSKTPRAGRP